MTAAYCDPNNPGNGAQHHTGEPCIEPGCDEPAGTAWGPWWCFGHNVERLDRIDAALQLEVDRHDPAKYDPVLRQWL